MPDQEKEKTKEESEEVSQPDTTQEPKPITYDDDDMEVDITVTNVFKNIFETIKEKINTPKEQSGS